MRPPFSFENAKDMKPTTYAKYFGTVPDSGLDGCNRNGLCSFNSRDNASFTETLYYDSNNTNVILKAPTVSNLPIYAYSLYVNSLNPDNSPSPPQFNFKDNAIGPHVHHLWLPKKTDLTQFQDLDDGRICKLHLFDPNQEPSLEEVRNCEYNTQDCPGSVKTYDFSKTEYQDSYGVYNACSLSDLSRKVSELDSASETTDMKHWLEVLLPTGY